MRRYPLKVVAESAAARVERQAWRKRLRAEDRQRARDEKHEAKAAAVACLIEAFIELRPYVGTEGIET
jgi:maltooligosyltrehalose synthase